MILLSEEDIKDEGENLQIKDLKDDYLDLLPSAIEQLEDSQRWCVVLFYLQGKSYKEIESIKGYSFNKIKSSIQHGKRNLRKIIMKE